MKKLFLVFALLSSGICFDSVVYATPAPQVCDYDKPCLYTGEACTKEKVALQITVYYAKDGRSVLAQFVWMGNKQVVYCYNVNQSSEWYFNWEGKKYYFNM